jgi:hypothetical protein
MQVDTQKLVDEFGDFWQVTDDGVRQEIGTRYDGKQPTQKEAEDERKALWYQADEITAARAEERLDRYKALIWMAENGLLFWKPKERVESIKKGAANLREKVKVRDEAGPKPVVVHPLPETMNVPYILPEGYRIYTVHTSWINHHNNPIRIKEHVVTKRIAYDRRDSNTGGFDLDVCYYADKVDSNDDRPQSFSIETDDENVTEVKCNVDGMRVFLTREAAEAAAKEEAEAIYNNIKDWM